MLPLERQKLLKQTIETFPEWASLDRCILIGLRGSDAHGTKIEKGPNDIDDIDTFVVHVNPINHYLGLDGHSKKRTVWDTAGSDVDVLGYDIRKFMGLAAKSNPNTLNWLHNRPEDYLHVHPVGQWLIDNRHIFLSKEVFPRLVGYALEQKRRMNAEQTYRGYMGEKRKKLVDEFGYDLKNAAHCVRLLSTGIHIAQYGTYSSYCTPEQIDLIKDVKKGKFTLKEVSEIIDTMYEIFGEFESKSTLREEVDRKVVSNYLVKAINSV